MKYIFILLLFLSAGVHASNILDYGCVGDDHTDNTICINDALSSATAGTTVLVPVGIFRVSGTVHVPEMVTLAGENAFGSVIATHASFPPDTPVISMTDDDGICTWTAVRRIRILARHADIGVYSNCVNEASGLFNVTIENPKNIGVLFEKSTGGWSGPNHYSLVNVYLMRYYTDPGPDDRGIVIDSKGSKAWIIEGITIVTNAKETAGVGSVAFDVVAAHDIVLNSVHFEGYDVGVKLGNTQNVTIINAHGHSSMNDSGAALLITSAAYYTMVISLDGGANPPGYKAINDQHLSTIVTDNRTSIYVSE